MLRLAVNEKRLERKVNKIVFSIKFETRVLVFLFTIVVVPKIGSLEKKSFSIILKHVMILPVVSYQRENIIVHEKNFLLKKNNAFYNYFVMQFFLTIAF